MTRVFTRSATVRNTEHIGCVVQNNVRTLQWEKWGLKTVHWFFKARNNDMGYRKFPNSCNECQDYKNWDTAPPFFLLF